MKHNNDFKYDLKVGKKGEMIVAGMHEGDKIEVKSEQTKIDNNWTVSGNCYVEYESRDKKSGLSHTESKYWVTNFMDGDTHCFTIILTTKKMKEIARKYYKQNRVSVGGDEDTSKGVLVPIESLINPRNYVEMKNKEDAPDSLSDEDIIKWSIERHEEKSKQLRNKLADEIELEMIDK